MRCSSLLTLAIWCSLPSLEDHGRLSSLEHALRVGGCFSGWLPRYAVASVRTVTLGMLVLPKLVLRFLFHSLKVLRKAWYLRLQPHSLREICTTLEKLFLPLSSLKPVVLSG